MTEPSELRIPDILTFLAVYRHGSVTGAARDLSVSPSQVSKAVARLERHLKRPLLARRARGIAPSEDALRLVPRFEELVEKLNALSRTEDEARELKLTVAAPSYLCAAFLPTIVTAVPEARFRGLEVGAAFMRAYATENLFEVALTIGAEKMPPSWVSTRAGSVKRSLFTSPELARRLGHTPSVAKVAKHPFVLPLYNSGGQFLPGDDGCPMPREERIPGHEAATIGVALALGAATDQLVFGPTLAARTLVLAGRLVEVRVPGWRLVDNLYFHANGDRVLARVQRTVVAALRTASAED